VEELARMARAAGAFEMWVETEADNVAANALYEQAGAVNDGTFVAWVWKL
jgi:ribosomal protein S18 acetylase RimI-like enzyme